MNRTLLRAIALPMLLGAISSTAPVARWCPMPWDRVPAAIYLHCSLFATTTPVRFAMATTCAGSRSCASRTPLRRRAYCLADPGLSSVWRPHVPTPRNPSVVVAVLTAAAALAPPAPAFERARGLEPEARPPGANPASRPPVRGPPPELLFA